MQALFIGVDRAQMAIEISFEDFLASGHMFRESQAAMCNPEELISDYVQEDVAQYGNDDEIGEAYAEAALLASGQTISNVELDRADIGFVRQHFGRTHGFVLMNGGIPPLAA